MSSQLNDKEKLIALFAGLNKNQSEFRGIERKNLSALIYLIGKDAEGSFLYNFIVRTNPFSDDLEEDLDDLLRARLLQTGSPITITNLGEEYYESLGENAAQFFETIKDSLIQLVKMSYSDLQELVYLRLTR